MRTRLKTLAALGVLSAASAVVMATGSGIAHADTARQTKAVDQVQMESLFQSAAHLSERTFVADMLPDEADPLINAPLFWQLGSTDEGGALIDDRASGKRLVAFPTTRGDICYGAFASDAPVMASCHDKLPESGAALSFATSSIETLPDAVYGLLSSDVDSVSIHTNDGKVHNVSADDGAVWWTSQDPAARVDSVTTKVNGKSFTEDAPDLIPAELA